MPEMNSQPLLSYIVLSYNYEEYIGTTLRSILEQTVQDFEIVVVDDCSRDRSVEVVRSFNDPRIRLIVNEQNLGGAGSYNRAVEAARGTWLVNLDADDWIAPNKAEIQLRAAQKDPRLDIIGTHVKILDHEGKPHPDAPSLEAGINQPHNLNLVQNWVGMNWLCRSSSMVRREAHLRIGLDDAAMVRAPDYELWTRALRMGCKFAIVPQQLTFMRLHKRGVTHADPLGQFLELSYAMMRNLIPLAEARALHPTVESIIAWVARHGELCKLEPRHAYRLLGIVLATPEFADFTAFRSEVLSDEPDNALVRAGRRALTTYREGSPGFAYANKLERDIGEFIHARNYWQAQAEHWERVYHMQRTRYTPRRIAAALLRRAKIAPQLLRKLDGSR
ncbi:glycosyltransferase family 2 protein [Cupriavidus neocaledonicus]|uniref:Glycosyl transferase family 2 n=1 Tax=Cupriavidus neocaledonicus TaxID=1040979 RepID=A0A375HBP3_9BURK|nr:glycosyltransferase family 2 protein [Cupriavidus neocaledonicus]SOZ35762.1 Glycosyl transferase family 2 [Cupriavidus neocaledonicus]SPD47729.1 Glycosyltransferase, GT2 family [Cupriavidus neocaledonicus]